jgi:hypothetical protein
MRRQLKLFCAGLLFQVFLLAAVIVCGRLAPDSHWRLVIACVSAAAVAFIVVKDELSGK